jgi:hypothetical protein
MSTPASLSPRVAPIAWRLATVVDVVQETSRARTRVSMSRAGLAITLASMLTYA